MKWVNTETKAFSGTSGNGFTETLDLVDRDNNVLKRYTKDATGTLTETVQNVTPAVSRVVRGTIDTALSGSPVVLQFGNFSFTTGTDVADDDDGTELIPYLDANKHLIPASAVTDETNGVFTITFVPGANTSQVISNDAALTFAEVTVGLDEVTELLTPTRDNGTVIVATGQEPYVTITDLVRDTVRITKVVVTALPVTIGNTTGVSFGFEPLVTFPAGKIHFLSSNVEDFSWGLENIGNATPIAGTMGGDISLGSAGTADATLNGAEVNLLASTSYDPFSTPISVNSGINAILDGTTTPITVYLNALIDDADVADAASDVLEANGTFYFVWYQLPG